MNMKGKRTLAANGAVLLVAMAAMLGVELPVEMADEAIVGALAIVNIVLRFFTSTPVGKSK